MKIVFIYHNSKLKTTLTLTNPYQGGKMLLLFLVSRVNKKLLVSFYVSFFV